MPFGSTRLARILVRRTNPLDPVEGNRLQSKLCIAAIVLQHNEEVSADYTDMIYAASPTEIEERRRAFIRKWRLKCKAVADSLEEAGDRLFTFTRLPPSQWKSARTTNAIERLHEEFKRRIKTQTLLPSARNCGHVALGAACRWSDHHTKSRRLANPRPEPH